LGGVGDWGMGWGRGVGVGVGVGVDGSLSSIQSQPSSQINQRNPPLHHTHTETPKPQPQGIKVSVNDCIVRAVALALRDVPEANASWDAAAGAARLYPNADIAIAVATEGGLITPIVRDAASKSLAQVRLRLRSCFGCVLFG